MMNTRKYLQTLFPVFNTHRTKEIFSFNPTVTPVRTEAANIHITVKQYNEEWLREYETNNLLHCSNLLSNDCVTWINIDGLQKNVVEQVCTLFDIHFLIIEDILSIGQRPKMDDFDNQLYCLLNMLFFDKTNASVEQEQISIILGKNYVITFQEDNTKDVFTTIREKLKFSNSKLRQSSADYLYYVLLDQIVDHYFIVMEQLSDRMEAIEEEIIRNANTRSLARINSMRKEMIVMKRNILPVKDLVSGILRSESELLIDRNTKYFKDVHDHITQAADMIENYRDMMMSLQDLYMNRINMKMNEVMKVMAIVTCLLAPATVIGGIFGMNFDRIPYLHHKNGFFIAVSLMLLIPVWMVWTFKKRGWF